MNNQFIKNEKGFTLVETLFAVFILTFVIVGLMTVVSNSLFASRYARDEITANYLLQESIDYIRNDRDTFVFSQQNSWTDFVTRYGSCTGEPGCYFNVLDKLTNPTILTIDSCESNCPILYYNDSATDTPFYVVDDGSGMTGMVPSKFRRKVTIETPNLYEMIVTVTVSWKNGGAEKERVLQTSLTNWQSQ